MSIYYVPSTLVYPGGINEAQQNLWPQEIGLSEGNRQEIWDYKAVIKKPTILGEGWVREWFTKELGFNVKGLFQVDNNNSIVYWASTKSQALDWV